MQTVNPSKLISVLSSTCLQTQLPCCTQFIFVRWRKPRWFPPAKTKLFRLPNRIRPPPDQAAERKYLSDRQKLGIKSIYAYQKSVHYGGLEQQLSAAQGALDDAELEKIMEENEKANAIVRERRERIAAENWKLLEQEIAEKKLEYEMKDEQTLAQREKEIEYEVERAKKAIRIEDLDDLIEKALATEVDENFAIDKYGNRYPGRFNSTTKVAKEATQQPSAHSGDQKSNEVHA